MITQNQIKSLSEEELGYLYICCNEEFLNSGFDYFSLDMLKVFRWESIPHILNKYSHRLKDDQKDFPKIILDKMASNLN
jgi:hypothetical protein